MDPGDDNVINTTDEVIDRTLAVNVKGVIYGCRYVQFSLLRTLEVSSFSTVFLCSMVTSAGHNCPQCGRTQLPNSDVNRILLCRPWHQ